MSPFAIPALSGSMAACMLSMEWGLTGPVMSQTAACATSIIAFHDALRLIQSGEVDVVLTGGSEAPVLPVGIAALGNMGALSQAQRRAGAGQPARSTATATASSWARAAAWSSSSRWRTRWRAARPRSPRSWAGR